MKDDLVRLTDEFHANGKMVKGYNSSYIVLIPKKDGACHVKDFWPISLIGSMYKIIAKVLARRMKSVMEKLIGESQSAFLVGKNILGGAVILNEILEEARRNKRSRLILKVDFAKAHDSIDWSYLFEMLRLMNFLNKWVGWMKSCVSSASANVLVNGSPSGEFQLERGLRQGNPLSPFCFS